MNMKKIRKGQQGTTLIEFMVAVAVGLILILAATSTFIVQNRAFGTQTDVSQTRDVVRMASTHMTRALRLSGFRSVGESPTTAFVALTTQNTADTNGSDRIVTRFYGAGTGANGNGTVVNCQGQGVNGTTLVTTHYSVRTVGSVVGLFCSLDAGANWTLLFPGIESMQVLQGTDLNADNSVDTYGPPPATLTATADAVRSLDVSFVVTVGSSNNLRTGTQVFSHFGPNYSVGGTDGAAVYTAPNDGRFRMQERMTVALRNRLN